MTVILSSLFSGTSGLRVRLISPSSGESGGDVGENGRAYIDPIGGDEGLLDSFSTGEDVKREPRGFSISKVGDTLPTCFSSLLLVLATSAVWRDTTADRLRCFCGEETVGDEGVLDKLLRLNPGVDDFSSMIDFLSPINSIETAPVLMSSGVELLCLLPSEPALYLYVADSFFLLDSDDFGVYELFLLGFS